MVESIIPQIFRSNVYLHSASVLIFFFLSARIFVWIAEKYITRLTAKTKTDIDDRIIAAINGPVSLLIFIVGVRLAVLPLQLSENMMLAVNKTISSLLVMTFIYLLNRITVVLSDFFEKKARLSASKIDDQIVLLSKRFSKVILIIVMILWILSVWKVNILPLLGTLGIAGLAVAFAVQSTLGNIFGGISLILDRSIKVGDIVKLESGEMGTVFDVGLRATRIRTADNEIIIVPNGQLANGRITNLVLPDPSIRLAVSFSVQYGIDPDFVKSVVKDELKKVKLVMKEPAPIVLFESMGDSALIFKALFHIEDFNNKLEAQQDVMTSIYRCLYKEGIDIPFPQRTVWMYDAGKAPKPLDGQYRGKSR